MPDKEYPAPTVLTDLIDENVGNKVYIHTVDSIECLCIIWKNYNDCVVVTDASSGRSTIIAHQHIVAIII